MAQHKRTSKGIRLKSAAREVFVPFITADDLLRHVGTEILPGLSEEWDRALDLGYELERSRRMQILRDYYLAEGAFETETEPMEYVEARALADGVPLSFINDRSERRGRPRHPEAVADLELLEEVEAVKSEQGFRSVKRALVYLAERHPDFLDQFVQRYDHGLTTRDKQVAAIEVRLSQLRSLLRGEGGFANSGTVLARLIRREVAHRGEPTDMGRRLAGIYLADVAKNYYLKKRAGKVGPSTSKTTD